MATYTLTWLPDVLEAAGLKVAEEPGWRSRGHGDVGTIKGVMCHHTGTAAPGNMPTLGVLKNGRTGLSGPLSQLGLGLDGTYYVVAAGRAYHAGAGEWEGITTGNSSFIGIEAENAGTQSAAWPDIQMDAYIRGVAAILKHIGANSLMCCGHREYALPQGRKDDPTFNMFEFRRQVGLMMAGNAPNPKQIPRVDGKGRPTVRRGATGSLVTLIQSKVNVGQSGSFDALTEAAVRQFQRDTKVLVADGIVGPRTWEALDPAGTAIVSAPPHPAIDRITKIAAKSQIATYHWPNRGVAPKGYVKGMALAFARVYCKLKAGDAAALEMAKARSGIAGDALELYNPEFTAAGMLNDTAGADTLRHLFVLLIGLGMRESSGQHCEGRDMSATNDDADTAEAGLFQTSYNGLKAHPLMATLYTQYKADPSGFEDVFKEGVQCKPASWKNWGTGEGVEFQKLSKTCPAFAAEVAAVGLRNKCNHWGPIKHKAAEVRKDCDAMLKNVQADVDANPSDTAAYL